MRRWSSGSHAVLSRAKSLKPHSRGVGGCLFAYTPGELDDAVIWRPELTAVTVILDASPEGFGTAKVVDPLKLGALLADQAGVEGRHVVVADRDGEHSLWLRNAAPGQVIVVFLIVLAAVPASGAYRI